MEQELWHDLEPVWKPGDIANGHVLAEDGTWRPLQDERPARKTRWWVAAVVSVPAMFVATLGLAATNDGTTCDDYERLSQRAYERGFDAEAAKWDTRWLRECTDTWPRD